jgi:hypothetical protein
MEHSQAQGHAARPGFNRRTMIMLAAAILLLAVVLFARANDVPYELHFDKPVVETRQIDRTISYALLRVDIHNPNAFPVWIRTMRREAAIDGYRNDPGTIPFESEIAPGGRVSVASGTILLDHLSPAPRNGTMDFHLCFGRAADTLDRAKTIQAGFRMVHKTHNILDPVMTAPRVTDARCG